LGASNSWNPQGLSRPVMGLLYYLVEKSGRKDFGFKVVEGRVIVIWTLHKYIEVGQRLTTGMTALRFWSPGRGNIFLSSKNSPDRL
jgi:hypothetical protein